MRLYGPTWSVSKPAQQSGIARPETETHSLGLSGKLMTATEIVVPEGMVQVLLHRYPSSNTENLSWQVPGITLKCHQTLCDTIRKKNQKQKHNACARITYITLSWFAGMKISNRMAAVPQPLSPQHKKSKGFTAKTTWWGLKGMTFSSWGGYMRVT